MLIDEKVLVDEIIVSDRQRKDLGDIDKLVSSIKEFGIIQPIVLSEIQENDLTHYKLIAGGRRLEALKKLGIIELRHGTEFIWRDEIQGTEPERIHRRKAIELEENLRRKQLTWQEEILAKQELLSIYQDIYGTPSVGQPSISQQQGFKAPGFGVRKLAEMLGESAAQTSQDLELAALITKLPILQKEENRDAARRRLDLAVKIAGGQAAPNVATALSYRILIICDDESHQKLLLEQLRSAGLKCTPMVA